MMNEARQKTQFKTGIKEAINAIIGPKYPFVLTQVNKNAVTKKHRINGKKYIKNGASIILLFCFYFSYMFI